MAGRRRRGGHARSDGARSSTGPGELSLATYVQVSMDDKLARERAASRRSRRRRTKRSKADTGSREVSEPGQSSDTQQALDSLGGDVAMQTTVVVTGMADVEEWSDPDEFEDVKMDLRATFERFGELRSLHLCADSGVLMIDYESPQDAAEAVRTVNGKLYGGRPVAARLEAVEPPSSKVHSAGATHMETQPLPLVEHATEQSGKGKKKRRSKCKSAVLRDRETRALQAWKGERGGGQEVPANSRCSFRVRNLVQVEELVEDDEFDELQAEFNADFARFGKLVDVLVRRTAEDNDLKLQDAQIGDVVVVYQSEASATAAFRAFNGNVFGGRTVSCFWSQANAVGAATVVVEGMLTPEELEDPDEFIDAKEDALETFAKYGQVQELAVCKETGTVTVTYQQTRDAQAAVQAMGGSHYGGNLVKARVAAPEGLTKRRVNAHSAEIKPEAEASGQQLYREKTSSPPELADIVCTLLKRLATLQERAHIQNPLQDRRSRRVVLGMHEVRRGLINNKLRLLLVANDLEESGMLNDKMLELVTLASEQEVPVLSPLNRRKLGRMLKKSVRVSCVGVYSVEGANELFQKTIGLSRSTQPS